MDITTRILLSVALPSLREQVEPAFLSAGIIVDLDLQRNPNRIALIYEISGPSDQALAGQLIGRFSGTRQSGDGSPSARIKGGHRATTI